MNAEQQQEQQQEPQHHRSAHVKPPPAVQAAAVRAGWQERQPETEHSLPAGATTQHPHPCWTLENDMYLLAQF